MEEEERSREGFIFAGSGREIGFVTSAGERALEEEERFDAGGGEWAPAEEKRFAITGGERASEEEEKLDDAGRGERACLRDIWALSSVILRKTNVESMFLCLWSLG